VYVCVHRIVYVRVCVCCVLVRMCVCARVSVCVHAHVKGLKTPFLLVTFFPKRGPDSQAVCSFGGGLEGQLGRLSQPVPIHA
jgi:hypothetical protein